MNYLKEAYPSSNYNSLPQDDIEHGKRYIFLIAGAGLTQRKLENIMQNKKNNKKMSTVATIRLFKNMFGTTFSYLGVDTDSIGLSGSKWSLKQGAERMNLNDATKSKRIMNVVEGIKSIVKSKETPIDIIGLSHGSVAGAQAIFLLIKEGYRIELLLAAKSMIKRGNPLHSDLRDIGVKVLFSPNLDKFEDPVTEVSGDSKEEAKENCSKVISREAKWVLHNKIHLSKLKGHQGGAEDITHAGRMFTKYFSWITNH